MNEEKLIQYLNTKHGPAIIADALKAKGKSKSYYDFWNAASNATAKGTRQLKGPAAKGLIQKLNSAGPMNIIPSQDLQYLYARSDDGTEAQPSIPDPIKPADFRAGGANIPGIEDFSVQPVIPPSRAQALKGDGNIPEPNKNASIPPKKASRTKDEGISAPDMENPFEKSPNALKLGRKGDAKDDSSELFTRLKSLGFESLNKQVEQYEAREDPETAARLERTQNLKFFLDQSKKVLGPLVDTIDFIEQRRQTKQAEAVANKSMKQAPAPPMVRGENRILSNLIRDSQIAYSNPSQMIQPYQDQIDLGYQQDLSQAQELSGGQAGNMIGMSQAAAIRRNEASQKVAPMASQIYQQGLETTGALVGQQMQDDAWRDQQTISLYDTANRNNQEFQQQAGLGLAASRARQVQARNNMLDSLLQSPVFDVDSYMGYTRKNLTNPPTI